MIARLIPAAGLLAGLTLALGVLPAAAHSESVGFLTAAFADGRVEGRVDLAVRDLDAEIGLDADGDGSITWGEVRAREAAIAAALLDGIALGPEAAPCVLEAAPLAVVERGGEPYLAAAFAAPCAVDGTVTVGYGHLFDHDAAHRGLVAATIDGVTHAVAMTPDSRSVRLGSAGRPAGALFLDFVVEGVHHILIGYDHILFLVTLMLGAVAHRAASDRRGGLRGPVVEIAKVVTAFTLAHSVTLALAALDVVRPPVALVEAAIAATIVVAAANAVFPVLTGRTWLIALGFGLIHGFGFANVLADLGLPAANLALALLAFNLGVELGQLAIVAVVLPVLVLAARARSFSRAALPAASLAIAAVGAAWFVDRVFGVALLPIG